MRLQHTSLMSCIPLLFIPSLRPLAGILNVPFPGGMQIVQRLFEKSVLPFLAFDYIVGDVHCLQAFRQAHVSARRTLKKALQESWRSYLFHHISHSTHLRFHQSPQDILEVFCISPT